MAGEGEALGAAGSGYEPIVHDGGVVDGAGADRAAAALSGVDGHGVAGVDGHGAPGVDGHGGPRVDGYAAAGVDERALDMLFREARTTWTWRDQDVDDDTLRRMYGLLKWGPTSANCSPARFLFLRTEGAKRRLRPSLSAGNADKAVSSPLVAIVAYDPRFYEDLPRLYPGADARAWFAGNDVLAEETAFRNGTLQGAYLMMAARAVGLDCGPMSGFDSETVDREFLVAQGWKSNFLVALGYGDKSQSGPRLPRMTFDEACRLL